MQAVLAYNNENGKYGIRLLDSKTWINNGLNQGDKVTLFDYFNGNYLEDEILIKFW